MIFAGRLAVPLQARLLPVAAACLLIRPLRSALSGRAWLSIVAGERRSPLGVRDAAPERLHVHQSQAGAFGESLRGLHVARDACGASRVVDGNEPFPLLHCARRLARDVEAQLLHLGVEAIYAEKARIV